MLRLRARRELEECAEEGAAGGELGRELISLRESEESRLQPLRVPRDEGSGITTRGGR